MSVLGWGGGGFMIPPPLEMSTYFMDGLFPEDKYWVTSTDYEPMKAKPPYSLWPKFKPQSQIDIWDVDIKIG